MRRRALLLLLAPLMNPQLLLLRDLLRAHLLHQVQPLLLHPVAVQVQVQVMHLQPALLTHQVQALRKPPQLGPVLARLPCRLLNLRTDLPLRQALFLQTSQQFWIFQICLLPVWFAMKSVVITTQVALSKIPALLMAEVASSAKVCMYHTGVIIHQDGLERC